MAGCNGGGRRPFHLGGPGEGFSPGDVGPRCSMMLLLVEDKGRKTWDMGVNQESQGSRKSASRTARPGLSGGCAVGWLGVNGEKGSREKPTAGWPVYQK